MESLKRRRETEETAIEKRAKPATIQSKLPFSSVRLTPPPSGQFPGSEVRIACWNVNGLRSCVDKDAFLKFIEPANLDILCLNEHKLQETHVDEMNGRLRQAFRYQYYNCSVRKKGYSGVAVLSKTEAIRVQMGIGVAAHDSEGRVLLAEFSHFLLIVVYTPNSGGSLSRLDYRVSSWDPAFRTYLHTLTSLGKPLLCLGDFNVVHHSIDICESDRDIDTIPGTTSREKESFTGLLGANIVVDSFRSLHPASKQFSWFANEAEWRKEQGWRLDYALVSPALMPKVKDSVIYEKVRASDHCPIELVLENSPV